MARRKSPYSQAQLREFQHNLAILKKAGIVRGDIRKKKPTKHYKKLLLEYSDVIEGKAEVVKTPRFKDARAFEGKYKHRYNRVVVPKAPAGGKAHYDKKRNTIVQTENYGDVRLVARYEKFSLEQLRHFEGRPNIYFRIAIRRGGDYEYFRTDNLNEFIEMFERSSWKGFQNWADFVVVEEAVRGKQHAKELFSDNELEIDE